LRTVTTISIPVARLLKQASDGLRLLEGSVIGSHIMPVQHNAKSHCLFINRQLPVLMILYSARTTRYCTNIVHLHTLSTMFGINLQT